MARRRWQAGERREPPGRYSNAHPNIVPYHVFPTADEPIILAVGNDAQLAKLSDLAGRPELAENPDFATNAQRVKNRARLVPIVEEILKERPARVWLEALEAAGIPSGPINDLDQVFASPQARARGMRMELPHKLAGHVPLVKNPTNFSLTTPEYRPPPPLLGEHTEEVL
ncbi:MAG: CoA transferase [Alphaproteobacteria bacterium]